MIKKGLLDFFRIKDSNKTTIYGALLTFVICFASYSAFIVYNFASPDGILEGLHFYINRHWAIAGCGRWFLALVNMAHANLVFPWLTIIECIVVNWLSAHTICKIMDIDNKWSYYLTCIIFAIFPPFIEMSTYTYMIFPYSLSILFSILFVYFNLKNSKLLSLLSSLLLGCAMGAYQAQIGVAVGLTAICIIKKLINKNDDVLSFTIYSLLSGLLGALIYVVGLRICLSVFGLELYSRAASFSINSIFSNFLSRFLETYKVFFSTFNQITLKRKYIYIVLLIIFVIEFTILLIDLLKKKKYKTFVLVLILILLLPPAFNIIAILLPNFEVTPLMLTPNYIIIPFSLYFLQFIKEYLYKVLSIITILSLVSLSWTYVLSANATYDSYRMSYNSYKIQFSNAIDKVLDLDGYEINSTRIVVIGRPNDYALRENIATYNYAINLYHNLLYWETSELDFRTTTNYIINEFGINPGVMEYEEYISFINQKECQEMPSWPKEGSVQMINGCAVIKFCEEYD